MNKNQAAKELANLAEINEQIAAGLYAIAYCGGERHDGWSLLSDDGIFTAWHPTRDAAKIAATEHGNSCDPYDTPYEYKITRIGTRFCSDLIDRREGTHPRQPVANAVRNARILAIVTGKYTAAEK